MKVSVIMPVLNTSAKFLKQSIESILHQTYKDFELVIIDDSNSQETLNCLEEYKKYEKISIYKGPNKSLGAAHNFGREKSIGELIAVADSDDICDVRRLELQIKEFEKDINLCATDAIIIDENNEKTNQVLLSCNNLQELDKLCNIVHTSIMYRKSFFNDNKLYYDETLPASEDYDLWFQYRTIDNKYIHIKEPLVYYRNHNNSASKKNKTISENINKSLYKKYNISPVVSIFYLDNKNIEKQNLNNFEIIDDIKKANGKYIAFSKYINNFNRLLQQVNFLDNNKDFVGLGSFIETDQGHFFYQTEPHQIENELLKGHIPIEPGTFLVRKEELLKEYDQDFFKLYCNLLKYGKLGNFPNMLIKCKKYIAPLKENLPEKIKYAKEKYKDIINIAQLNITSDGNISGVDKYITTLENNYPPNIRCFRITFITSNKLEWKINYNHTKIYYNSDKTKLEHIYDQLWDNLSSLFNRHNLILQSNCLNLYSLITYIRQKVNCKHICVLHCIPHREVIRTDRQKYYDLEKIYKDVNKDFIELPEHILPISLADHVILNTQDSVNYYERMGYLTQYSLIYNGIEYIGKGKNITDIFKFLFVGHSSMLKGMDQLIDIISETDKNFEVYWAGSNNEKLISLIKQKNVPIIPLGVLQQGQLNELYRSVDAVLIATACETCSYAAIEALSAGLPIISTNAPGVSEIIKDVGILVDINDYGIINKEQYKDAIKKVISNKQLREEMSKKSLKKSEQYNIKTFVEKSINLYKELLK